MKTRTSVNVPIIDAGFLGLNGMIVSMVMKRKYTFAALLNWNRSDSGAQVKIVYLVVRTLFDSFCCSSGFYSLPKTMDILFAP